MQIMRLLTVLAATFLTGSAFAQPDTVPTLSVPEYNISMSVGQSHRLNFPTVFDRIELSAPDVVQAKPLSDRVLTLHGLGAGETLMTVFAGNQELYSALLSVSAGPGHLVKIYASGKHDDTNAGHVAVFCNERGCGRPDTDMPRPTISIHRYSGTGPINRQ